MKKHSVVAAFLVSALLTSALSGCGGTSESGSSTPAESSATEAASYLDNMTAPGEYPIVKEQVTLSVWIDPPSWIGDLDDNYFTKYYEEKTNIDFEFTRSNMEDHNDKMNLILASQADLPDMFISWGITNAQQIEYGSQGVFVPLNDLIEEYGLYTKQVFAYEDTIEKSVITPDGSIYGLPAVNECYHCTMPYKAWVDKTWLENLNLEMPETTDDFYNMLKAFKEQDANGNGDPNDEIPLARGGWSSEIDMFLMNAFTYNAGGARWFLDNGTVVGNAVTPEWREGLKYMNKLFAEGLIDPEYMISDNETAKLLTGAENGNRAGVVLNGAIQFVDSSLDVKENFVAIPPLTGPEGVHYTAQYPISLGQGNFVITKECEIPEIAFRLGDSLYQCYIENDYHLFGEENVDWRYAEEGEVGLDGQPAKYAILHSGQEPNNFTWSEGINTFLSADFRNSMAVDITNWDSYHEKILYDETANKYEGNGPAEIMPTLFYTQEEQEKVTEIETLVNKYITESITAYITGTRDINDDNDWNQYVEELEKMGYSELRDLVQASYDRVK